MTANILCCLGKTAKEKINWIGADFKFWKVCWKCAQADVLHRTSGMKMRFCKWNLKFEEEDVRILLSGDRIRAPGGGWYLFNYLKVSIIRHRRQFWCIFLSLTDEEKLTKFLKVWLWKFKLCLNFTCPYKKNKAAALKTSQWSFASSCLLLCTFHWTSEPYIYSVWMEESHVWSRWLTTWHMRWLLLSSFPNTSWMSDRSYRCWCREV